MSLDHEAEPTVTVTVTATDSGGLSKAQSFDITVADLNEGPTAVSLSASDVDENDAGAVIGTVTVTAPTRATRISSPSPTTGSRWRTDS